MRTTRVDPTAARIVAGLALVALCVLATSAAAAPPAGCVLLPLPTTPVPPVYTGAIAWLSDQARLELWRQPCANDASQFAALLRVTPITPEPFVCGINFFITQGATQFQATVRTSQTGSGFCTDLPGPQTLLLTEEFGASGTLNVVGGFSVVHDGVTSTQVLDVPPRGGALPPSVTVVSTGCNPCHSGQVVAFQVNLANPGPSTTVEVKGGARFPDGSVLALLNQTIAVGSGSTNLPFVPAQPLPLGLPTIDLVVEAALVDPVLGTTLSRHSVVLHLLP
jgi:hypothetical protein